MSSKAQRELRQLVEWSADGAIAELVTGKAEFIGTMSFLALVANTEFSEAQELVMKELTRRFEYQEVAR